MVRPKDVEIAKRFDAALRNFDRDHYPLPGVAGAAERATLVEQILESARRIAYVSTIATRDISERRANPSDELFDPLKAAIWHQRQGRIDEAYWLVFLFVHFGKHARAGWRYAREVYGRLGGLARWDWATVSRDPTSFSEWLRERHGDLLREGVARGFGNHRKYESLSRTSAAVESYVRWVNPPRTHAEMVEAALIATNHTPREAFDYLYRSMTVTSFGRTARFDYLTMVGKLGLSPIEPGSAYLSGATGPLNGARLLFGAQDGAASLNPRLVALGDQLDVGMQVVEDALCNWQKSPAVFRPFRL